MEEDQYLGSNICFGPKKSLHYNSNVLTWYEVIWEQARKNSASTAKLDSYKQKTEYYNWKCWE